MDEREPPDDPVDFLRWYRDGWNDLDLDRILDAYATPCFVSRAGGCCTITTTRPRPGTSRTCWTATGARGAAPLGAGRVDLRRLGRDGALVSVGWTCRRPDGSVIWEFPDSYLLAAEGGRWWIVGDVVHE